MKHRINKGKFDKSIAINIIVDNNQKELERLLRDCLGMEKVGSKKDEIGYLCVRLARGDYFEITESRNPRIEIEDIKWLQNYIG